MNFEHKGDNMNLSFKNLFCLGALALGSLFSTFGYATVADKTPLVTQPSAAEKSIRKSFSISADVFEHRMQLYLADAYGLEVPGTDFWITLTVVKEKLKDGYRVTLQLPNISFITGPYANNVYELNNPISELIDEVVGLFLPPPQNGGYLYTKDGFLPPELRPTDLLSRTYFGPSNNGQNIPFNYVANGTPPPDVSSVIYNTPQAGYLIRVTNSGGLAIEGIGTLANIIPPGTQQLIATDVSYVTKKQSRICKNKRISTGAINIAQYTLPPPTLGNVADVRDTHINDAWDNVVAYTWADNSNIPDAANNPNVMNLAYAFGTVKDGELKLRKAKFLPTPNNMFVWDTAVAINRTDKNNIVISYGLIDGNSPGDGLPSSLICAAVSYDGGKTWPINGPTNIQPTGFVAPGVPGGFGDNPGVRADKYGNFWYLSTNIFDDNGVLTDQPFIMVSSDKGATWELVYTYPYDDLTPIAAYDFPECCFGGDGLGNYGVQIVADYFPDENIGGLNGYPSRAFIPVTGLGTWGTVQQAFLPQLSNNIYVSSITASEDGKVWTYGSASGLGPSEYVFPGGYTNNRIVFKSPGLIDENYAGPWGVVRYNSLSDSLDYPIWEAAPLFGFFQSVQTNLYDDKRKALYAMLNVTYPELSNNSNIYFLISRDNGLSWSNPLTINTTKRNNRGFPSMALDQKTGNLLLGWYDCRDFKDGLSFNYWGAVIPSRKLSKLVKQISYSNPLFSVPAAGYDILPPTGAPLQPVAKGTKNKDSKKKDQKKANGPHARFATRLNQIKG